MTVDVVLRIETPGSIVGLFGPSGAGKSTLLSCIAGLEPLDDGHIVVDGRRMDRPFVPLHRRGIGYLPQDSALFPHLDVARNVTYARGANEDAQRAWIAELRERLDLDALWRTPVARLSGGQTRRVALARMLASQPSLVLLDEPFAGLDRGVARVLLETLHEWHRRHAMTAIVVDHTLDVLERIASRIVAMEDGRVAQDASTETIRARPATRTLGQLIAPW